MKEEQRIQELSECLIPKKHHVLLEVRPRQTTKDYWSESGKKGGKERRRGKGR